MPIATRKIAPCLWSDIEAEADGQQREKAARPMKAMLRMKKLDIAALERAYTG